LGARGEDARVIGPIMAVMGFAGSTGSVAAWPGSGLGIGLAEGREHLSAALTVGVAAVLAIGLIGRRLASRRGPTMNENSGT